MREERITSRQNPLLRHAKKLLTSRSYRESCGEFAADGTKLLEEAARWVPGLHTVIAADDVEICRLPEEVRVVRVPRDVMASVSQMDAPQGAIFLCRTPQPPQTEILPGTLLLDGIQDLPGAAGRGGRHGHHPDAEPLRIAERGRRRDHCDVANAPLT